MSVFQLQDWWSVKIANGEEFDHGSMCVGNIDNANPPSDKIVVSSLQGYLRVYSPTKPGFAVEDLIHEENLSDPILQISMGRFLPSSTTMTALAILHPRKLSVYELIANTDTGRVSFYSLVKQYEHVLGEEGKHFTAFNMTIGSFGGVSGRDMIMVQSMDGKLQVFEQSADAFSRQLVDCLFPGPLLYLPKLDAFVTSTYASRLECYRYQVLVNAQGDIGNTANNKSEGKSNGTKRGSITAIRGVLVEWSLNLGEQARQIICGKFSHNDSRRGGDEMLVLTDHSLFLVKDTGTILQQKRLDKVPSCVLSYPSGVVGQGHNFLLANSDQMLQVYSDFNLHWAAKTRNVPVHLSIASFGSNNRGMIVALDDSGSLTVGYLGTRPPLSAVGGVNHSRMLDYDKVDEEHKQLLQVIREKQSEHSAAPTDQLNMRVQMPKALDMNPLLVEAPDDVATTGVGRDGVVRLVLRLYLSYSNSTRAATNVALSVTAAGFITAAPSSIHLQQVSGAQSTPVIVHVTLMANRSFIPTNLDVKVSGSYTGPNGEPRVVNQAHMMPLAMACKLRTAQKSATHRVTLETTEHAGVSLTELFGDFLVAQQAIGIDAEDVLGTNGGIAMGFQYWCNVGLVTPSDAPAIVSIVASKSGGRYRIHSDFFPALALMVRELERRLNAHIAATTGRKDQQHVSISDPLPIDSYFLLINGHFENRTRLQDLLSQLNDTSHEYRMVEKRLLVRFKDKNPSPLGGLDFIMRDAYSKLVRLADEVEDLQALLLRQREAVDAGTRCMVRLAGMKFGMSEENTQALHNYMAAGSHECVEQGWEDTVDASVTFVLKTSLAKNVKETTQLSPALDAVDNVEKFTKHVTIVFDRLSKGGQLVRKTGGAAPGESEAKN